MGAGATDSIEDPAVVQVPGDGVGGLDAGEIGGDDHRCLAREGDLAFEDEARGRVGPVAGHGRPRRLDLCRGVAGNPDLAPAVVPADCNFEPQRHTERGDARRKVGAGVHLAPGRHRGVDRFEESALGQPVLRARERMQSRAQRPASRDGLGRGEPDVLELVGDDVALLGQAHGRLDVVVGRDDVLVGNARCRATGIGVENGDAVAERAGRQRQHPPQLAATEDADRGANGDRAGRVGHGGECMVRGMRIQVGRRTLEVDVG